ncbi:MAG TPA: hypothetical protein PK640_22320, partial [Verrucomicrobiota bacterium]|nr:hypothetical protein [Verrucomicrobiota bacterium]
MNRKQQNHRTFLGQWARRCFVGALLLSVSTLVTWAVDRDRAMARSVPQIQAEVFDDGVDAALWYEDHEIEANWEPAYLERLKQ